MKNFFILHGTGGSPYGNWFKWLHDRLTERGDSVYVPFLPTIEKQSYDNWAGILKAYLDAGLINEDTTFVCHSSSPAFLVQFVLRHKLKIGKVIFVAGANNFKCGFAPIDNANKTFFMKNMSDFKFFCPVRICLYSENDKYIPLNSLKLFADEIDAKHILMKGMGHMNAETGLTEFPQIIEFL